MTLRQLELPMEPTTIPAPPQPWYLAKLDQVNWKLHNVALEEETLVVLCCARHSNQERTQLIYIPRYGRSVEDVVIEENGHIRTQSGRLLA